MQKRQFTILIILIALLAVSIFLMSLSLLLSRRVFGQVSSYIAIACVVVTLVGSFFVLRSNRMMKQEFQEDIESIEDAIEEDEKGENTAQTEAVKAEEEKQINKEA